MYQQLLRTDLYGIYCVLSIWFYMIHSPLASKGENWSTKFTSGYAKKNEKKQTFRSVLQFIYKSKKILKL